MCHMFCSVTRARPCSAHISNLSCGQEKKTKILHIMCPMFWSVMRAQPRERRSFPPIHELIFDNLIAILAQKAEKTQSLEILENFQNIKFLDFYELQVDMFFQLFELRYRSNS